MTTPRRRSEAARSRCNPVTTGPPISAACRFLSGAAPCAPMDRVRLRQRRLRVPALGRGAAAAAAAGRPRHASAVMECGRRHERRGLSHLEPRHGAGSGAAPLPRRQACDSPLPDCRGHLEDRSGSRFVGIDGPGGADRMAGQPAAPRLGGARRRGARQGQRRLLGFERARVRGPVERRRCGRPDPQQWRLHAHAADRSNLSR